MGLTVVPRWAGFRSPRPVNVSVGTVRGKPTFGDPGLAGEVFALLREHPRTLAAVVMPDHVHWLLRDGSNLEALVRRFKNEASRLAVAAGDEGPLWQRSFFDMPVESDSMARLSAGFLLANPVAAGLAARWQDYPCAYLDRGLAVQDLFEPVRVA